MEKDGEDDKQPAGPLRHLWFALGVMFLGLGAVGAVLPIMPTVVFLIVAAACFARSNPAWEARLMRHPVFGPHITAWRERKAVSRAGKWWATVGLGGGAIFSLFTLLPPFSFITPAVAAIVLPWLWSRPES
ncbi:YbaN family protein [Pacificimonas sp. WHA3]|uniref:YbaN family protein n=1 Tax=Pacificimonas pallii TaxID=2827236 RepID=A0ABS6SHS6_9SPHN|nr:YbaN family protein [Pacificimonas pallii]MBV7257461.1 YbaN family protein [Pacificimonas pallii]